MTTRLDIAPVDDADATANEPALALEYRALSSAAVASLLIGTASSLAMLDWFLTAIPVVGIVLGISAARNIARRQRELTGLGVARAGVVLSMLFFALGVGRLSWIYATEVPEGFTRISYSMLQPDPDNPDEIVPPSALALDGQKVFIKGYPLPGSELLGITRFVLVRDRGDCCFGGNPKLTDQIEVTLLGPLRLDYELRMLKLAGTFRVHPDRSPTGLGGAIYSLEANHLE